MSKQKKYRRHRKRTDKNKEELLIPIKPNRAVKVEKTYEASKTISLSETEQLRYVYSYKKIKDKRVATEVTSVGYDLNIYGKWETIVYYDNDASHDYILHRHIRISVENEKTISSTEGVKKKGTSQTFLTWCIEDIKKRHLEYKNAFLNRCKRLKLLPIDIDI